MIAAELVVTDLAAAAAACEIASFVVGYFPVGTWASKAAAGTCYTVERSVIAAVVGERPVAFHEVASANLHTY